MNSLSCGFIGLGLIGGSIARALREKFTNVKIIAYTPHASTVNAAIEAGIVDEGASEIDGSFTGLDYIFLCAPVENNNTNLKILKPFLSENTTLTDIGSVKTSIHETVKELGLEKQFIGGHPMTGTERIGFLNSKSSLLENSYYILSKTSKTDEIRLNNYYELVKTIGSIPLVVDYNEHDFATAAISHVPHVISASLVNLIEDNDNKEGLMKTIAAGGFKDITRISSSSPVMWQQICLTNPDNISSLLSKYIKSLEEIKKSIDDKDADSIIKFFEKARSYRESFVDVSRGPIKKVYTIHVDIADEPGNLAAVATLLAVNSINIKNIGIVHNREYEHGTLGIEFHDEDSQNKALQLLTAHGYPTIG